MTEHSVASGPWGPRHDAAAMAATPAATPDGPLPVVFTGSRADFARLTARGLLLYVPTFGFNRFWLRTDQRRFFWLNTTLGGDSFEYRGGPIELVVGFLFAIGIYMPLALGYSLLGLYAETIQNYASVPFFILTFAFGHFAAFRARRYRLTRTGFRGIRFWMVGSGWEMGFKAFAWLVFVTMTGGLAWPWMQAWIERYKMRRSRYGSLAGDFAGTGWELMKRMVGPGLLILGAGFIMMTFAGVGVANHGNDPVSGFLALIAAGVAVLVFVACAWSVLTAVRMRWWLNHVVFGEIRARSTLRAFALMKPAFRAGCVAALFLLIWALPALFFAYAGGKIDQASILQSFALAILGMGWTLTGLVILMFIKSVYYNFDLVQRVAGSLVIENAGQIAGVTAEGHLSGLIGEGLADSLGADGF